MEIIAKWYGLPAPAAKGEKVLLMDQIENGFLKLIEILPGSYVVSHETKGNNWVTFEVNIKDAKKVYDETLREELS